MTLGIKRIIRIVLILTLGFSVWLLATTWLEYTEKDNFTWIQEINEIDYRQKYQSLEQDVDNRKKDLLSISFKNEQQKIIAKNIFAKKTKKLSEVRQNVPHKIPNSKAKPPSSQSKRPKYILMAVMKKNKGDRAILLNPMNAQSFIVGETEKVEGHTVKQIKTDMVVLEEGEQEHLIKFPNERKPGIR